MVVAKRQLAPHSNFLKPAGMNRLPVQEVQVVNKLKRFLSVKEVRRLFADIPVSSLYQQIKDGKFPKPEPMAGGRRVGFDEDVIIEYQAEQAAKRDASGAA
jgi:predicted DNA-binding transcriptional regulator AlpA